MLTEEEFRLFSNLIYEESGIYLKETRKDFLWNRILKRMVATGMSSPYWYYKHITEKKKAELLILLDLLTVNETSFFRNRPQIELFRNIILPDVIRKKELDTEKKLRIWSAGCSTGEESYTIAMEVCETIISHNPSRPPLRLREGESGVMSTGGRRGYGWGSEWDIKIFASDLSLSSLETAIKGEYAEEKVHATVDDYYINKYFEKKGNYYRVRDEIRKLIIFDFHNLKHDNGLRNLDIIFCRNVMIYFDEKEQKRLIEKFYKSLNPGGYLLLGHAESLHGWDTGFEFVYENKGTAYKKPE